MDAESAADAAAEPEAPEAEAPESGQGEADEPESGDGQATGDPEAVAEQPVTPGTGQAEAEQQQAPGADAEPAADAALEPEAPEQGQADADDGSGTAADPTEADETESGEGQAIEEPEAVQEQRGTAETGQEEAERQQAPGAEPAAAAASAPDEPERPGTAETGQVEDEQQQAPEADAESAADEAFEPAAPTSDEPEQPAAAETEAVAPEPETGADEADRSGLDGEASIEADAAEIAADPASPTPQASGQNQLSGDSDELGEGSSDAAATQPAQGQADPAGGEDTATALLPVDDADAAVPEAVESAIAAETVLADEAPASDGATVPAESSSDDEAASPQQERAQEAHAEQTASSAAGSGGTQASEIPESGTARADVASGQDEAASEAAEAEELELAMLDDGVGQQAAAEPAPDAEPAPAAITVPTFDVVRVDAFGTTVVAGKAAPGDRVDALVNSAVAATETASSRGEFVMLFELDPQGGPLEIALLATGPGGSVRSAETVVVFDPASAADEEPSAEAAAADPAVLIALEDRVELLQPAIPPENNLAIESISYGEEGDPTVVAGRGAADGQVRILVDGRPVMTEQVSESGAWSADLEVPDAATHSLRVEELDEEGNVLASVETPFERTFEDSGGADVQNGQDAARNGILELDESVAVEIVTVEPGFTLWGISRKYYGKGRLYVRIYHSNLQLIEDPDLIFPGQQFVVPAFETAPPRRPD